MAQPQYPPQQYVVSAPLAFQSSLFGCFDDFATCLEVYFCHCLTLGRIRAVHEGLQNTIDPLFCVLGFLCPLITGCVLRGKTREKLNIGGDACNDCCTTWCCYACSVCQQANELNRRGLNTGALCLEPSLGPKTQQMGGQAYGTAGN